MTDPDLIRLIIDRFDSMEERIEEVKSDLGAKVEEVIVEAKKTNGRLRKLELWRHGLTAVKEANAWLRPSIVAFISGAGLTLFGILANTYLGG